jgi:hypothetical protein
LQLTHHLPHLFSRLTLPSDRELDQIAPSIWFLCSGVIPERFMSFSEREIRIILWFDSMSKIYPTLEPGLTLVTPHVDFRILSWLAVWSMHISLIKLIRHTASKYFSKTDRLKKSLTWTSNLAASAWWRVQFSNHRNEAQRAERAQQSRQFIRFSNTILMLETLHLWPTNPHWEFMFSLYWGADPHSIHGRLQQRQIIMECQFLGGW